MVRGLELFRERLGRFSDTFIVIGGTACDLALEDAGGFRATKDIDMIIITERVSEDFATALHAFLREGDYACYVTKDRRPHYYRFRAPKGSAYPYQIEMLSHSLLPDPDARFTPISLSETIRSLSAIVLDPVYYEFAKAHCDHTHGVPILTTEALIVFKSVAYLNLLADKDREPEAIRTEDVHKHRNDVFRLMGAIRDDQRVELPETIQRRLIEFADRMAETNPEWPDIIAAVGPLATSPTVYLARYRELFGL